MRYDIYIYIYIYISLGGQPKYELHLAFHQFLKDSDCIPKLRRLSIYDVCDAIAKPKSRNILKLVYV